MRGERLGLAALVARAGVTGGASWRAAARRLARSPPPRSSALRVGGPRPPGRRSHLPLYPRRRAARRGLGGSQGVDPRDEAERHHPQEREARPRDHAPHAAVRAGTAGRAPGADQRGRRQVGGELVLRAAGRPGGMGGRYSGSNSDRDQEIGMRKGGRAGRASRLRMTEGRSRLGAAGTRQFHTVSDSRPDVAQIMDGC